MTLFFAILFYLATALFVVGLAFDGNMEQLPNEYVFRTETGGMILLGKSMDEDPVGYSFGWDDQRFMELLWPELAEFVPAWERLKLVRGWAGLYDVNTLDHNAIIGEWPEAAMVMAQGFSA